MDTLRPWLEDDVRKWKVEFSSGTWSESKTRPGKKVQLTKRVHKWPIEGAYKTTDLWLDIGDRKAHIAARIPPTAWKSDVRVCARERGITEMLGGIWTIKSYKLKYDVVPADQDPGTLPGKRGEPQLYFDLVEMVYIGAEGEPDIHTYYEATMAKDLFVWKRGLNEAWLTKKEDEMRAKWYQEEWDSYYDPLLLSGYDDTEWRRWKRDHLPDKASSSSQPTQDESGTTTSLSHQISSSLDPPAAQKAHEVPTQSTTDVENTSSDPKIVNSADDAAVYGSAEEEQEKEVEIATQLQRVPTRLFTLDCSSEADESENIKLQSDLITEDPLTLAELDSDDRSLLKQRAKEFSQPLTVEFISSPDQKLVRSPTTAHQFLNVNSVSKEQHAPLPSVEPHRDTRAEEEFENAQAAIEALVRKRKNRSTPDKVESELPMPKKQKQDSRSGSHTQSQTQSQSQSKTNSSNNNHRPKERSTTNIQRMPTPIWSSPGSERVVFPEDDPQEADRGTESQRPPPERQKITEPPQLCSVTSPPSVILADPNTPIPSSNLLYTFPKFTGYSRAAISHEHLRRLCDHLT